MSAIVPTMSFLDFFLNIGRIPPKHLPFFLVFQDISVFEASGPVVLWNAPQFGFV